MRRQAAGIAVAVLAITLLVGAATILPARPSLVTDRDLCATPNSRDDAETSYLSENSVAMRTMMKDMEVKPSGEVDTDFVAMMVPHHRGAIEMALAVLKHGRNPQIKRMAQEIIVTQEQEITAMRLAVGQLPLPARKSPPQDSPSPRAFPSASTDLATEP